jgi:protein gp37
MRLAGTRLKDTPQYRGLTRASKAGPVWTGEIRVVHGAIHAPLRWRKPRRVFVNSMGDLFHEDVPLAVIQQIFGVMKTAKQHQFQVLTKRAERLAKLAPLLDWPPNVWMGVSVEDQSRAADRIPLLLLTDAAVKFLSCEPLLGWVTLKWAWLEHLNWVIVGGESGPNARGMAVGSARGIRDLCAAAGVPFFFKQMAKKAAIPPDLLVRQYPERLEEGG